MKNKLHTLELLRSILKGNYLALIFLLVLSVFKGLEGTVFAVLMSNVVDAAIAVNKAELIKYGLLLSGVVLIAIALNAITFFMSKKYLFKMKTDLTEKIFSDLIYKDYAYITSKHTGEWMSRISNDTNIIVEPLVDVLPGLVVTCVQLLSALTTIATMYPKIGILIAVAIVVFVVLMMFLKKQIKVFQTENLEKRSKLNSALQESLSNTIVIKSYSNEKNILETIKFKTKELHEAEMRYARFLTIWFPGMYAGVRIAYLAGVIICGYFIYHGTISFGSMTTILQLITLVTSPLTTFSSQITKIFEMFAAIERINDIEKQPIERIDENSKTVNEVLTYYNNSFKTIGLKNATFSYSENEYEKTIINDMDLEINKGDYVALLGQSGCGKSTVLKLLLCLYKLDKGERYLRNNDDSVIPLESSWRRLFAYVPQGNFLMSGTIREVVSFKDENLIHDDQKIWKALKVACADTFVSTLPQGLDTVLSERGAGLSEGQTQRLAIARAILSGRPILMLDECTSSLDEKTEKELLENLKAEKDYTVLLITHRPAALDICNKQVRF